MKIKNFAWLLVLILFASGCVSSNNTPSIHSSVQSGDKIAVDYTGFLDNGSVFDSSVGKQPLEFTVGASQVIKGFDQGVIGMSVNQNKTLHIEAQDAYGLSDPANIFNVSKKVFGNETVPPVGSTIYSKSGVPAIITKIYADGNITIDANSPLAGKALNFNITLIKIY